MLVVTLILACVIGILHREVLFSGAVYHMDDAADGYYPGRVAYRRALSEGSLPSWEPNAFLGWPLTADPYYGYFYPLNAVFFLGPRAGEPPSGLAAGIPSGLGLSAALHAVLAGVGMFVYLRRRRRDGHPLGFEAALFGAASYALSSFLVVRIRHIIFVQILAWLPLLLWALDQYLDGQYLDGPYLDEAPGRRRRLYLALCGLLLGLMLLSGAHSILHFIALLLLVYGLVRFSDVVAGQPAPARVRAALSLGGPLALAVLAGLMVAGLSLLPTLLAMPSTTRSLGTDYRFASSYAWPSWAYLQLLLAPDAFGIGETRQQDFFSPWNHWELAGYYQGVLALLLAIPGALLPRRGQRRRFDPERLALLGCLLGGIALAVGDNGPLHPFLFRYFPLYGALRCPARGLILYVIAAPILAAHAVDALFGNGPTGDPAPTAGRLDRRRLAFAGLLAAALLALGAIIAWQSWAQVPSQVARLQWVLKSRAHVSLVLAGFLALAVLRGLGGLRGRGMLLLLTALTIGDQLRTNRGYVLPQPIDYPHGMERFSAVEWLLQRQAQQPSLGQPPSPGQPSSSQPSPSPSPSQPSPQQIVPYRFAPDPRGPFRLFSVGQTLGMASASGYSSVQIWRYAQLLYILRHGRPYPHRRQVDDLAAAGIWNARSPIVDMLNIRYWLGGTAPSEKWSLVYSRPPAAPPHARFEGYWDAQLKVYENRQVMSRAYIAYQTVVAQDEADEARRIAAPDFDPHRFAIVGPVPAAVRHSMPAWPVPPPPRLPTTEAGAGAPAGEPTVEPAQVLHYERHRVVIQAVARQAGVLVLSDAYYPGWSATVDGVPQPIYPANLALRGVLLSPGSHRVEFHYDQRPLRRGAWLSALGLVVLGLMGLGLPGLLRRAIRRRKLPEGA